MAGIYIHIPFCKQACHYCNFHFSTSLRYKEELIQCIIREIELKSTMWETEHFESIYFGGGTPSLLDEIELMSIMNVLYEHFDIAEDAECTIEANPDDIDPEMLRTLERSPFNRISLGIQSLDDDILQFVNRSHDAAMGQKALELLSHSQVDNISCDLIFGIMGQSDESLSKDLDIILAHKADHISAYALSVEKGTALYSHIKSKKSPPVNNDDQVRHFHLVDDRLSSNQFDHYEVSNYARSNRVARHNSSYWSGESYMGIGPSAHSYTGDTRSWNVSNNIKYIQAITNNQIPVESEKLTTTDRYNETVMTSLRTKWGISDKKLLDLPDLFQDHFEKLAKVKINSGELIHKNEIFSIPLDKWIFADRISSDLFYIDELYPK